MSANTATSRSETDGLSGEERLLPSRRGEPAWELAERFFPRQGEWTEDDFLGLENNLRIELSDGVLEFLSMPTYSHHDVMQFLYERVKGFVQSRRLGLVYINGVKVKLWKGKVREPDVVYLRREQLPDKRRPSNGAELVMEVVSPDRKDRERDLVTKRKEYAKAGILEYWIVDPETETITVLTLEGRKYVVHGEFKFGDKATSVLLDGFEIDVTECFESGKL